MGEWFCKPLSGTTTAQPGSWRDTHGSYVEPKATKFEQFANEWMDGRVGVRGSTLSSYGSIVRKQLIPYFGKMSLSEIGYDQVHRFVHELANEISVKTLHDIIVCLRVMLVWAPTTSMSSSSARIATKAGLPAVRFHDLRHFFASMLIAQGESAKYACDQMGHSSIQVTFDTYGTSSPTHVKQQQRSCKRRCLSEDRNGLVAVW